MTCEAKIYHGFHLWFNSLCDLKTYSELVKHSIWVVFDNVVYSNVLFVLYSDLFINYKDKKEVSAILFQAYHILFIWRELNFRPYENDNYFYASVVKNQELYHGSSRSCRHIELDVSASQLRYVYSLSPPFYYVSNMKMELFL